MNNKLKLLSLAVPFVAAASLSAASLKTPFESLPSETVAAFRFDNSPETLAKYVDNTRIGQLLLSDEKVAEYKAFVAKMIESGDKEGNFLRTLGEVGLELDDLYEMVTSKIGAAVVEQEVPGHRPMPTLLVWAEMRPGVAERAFKAVLEGSAANENLERTDFDLPGGPGARIANKADGSSFLLARLDNRFFFALGQVLEPISDMEAAKVFENAELEALGQFLSAQMGGGGDFLSSFYADGGISEIRPSFYSRLEVLGDLQKILKYLPPQNIQMIQGLEIDKFTKFGVWSGLVDMEERSVLFLGSPSPRSGIAKLFENEFFDFQPPEWVPASVNAYTAVSFDMMKLYDFFLDSAKKFAPPEMVEQQVAMGNAQLQGMLQTDIPTLLSSFGKRIHVVEYPIEIATVTSPDGSSVEVPRSSQAIVMDFTRPEILQAGLGMMRSMGAQGGQEFIEEQGFSGIRMKHPVQGDVTVAFGLGKLVFAVGSETTASRIFSTLANLPEGEAALANSAKLREFIAEKGVKPGMLFSFSHGEQMLKNLAPVLKSLTTSLRNTSGEEAAGLMDELVALMPAEEELEGLLGIAFNRMYYNQNGLVIEGLNQYK